MFIIDTPASGRYMLGEFETIEQARDYLANAGYVSVGMYSDTREGWMKGTWLVCISPAEAN